MRAQHSTDAVSQRDDSPEPATPSHHRLAWLLAMAFVGATAAWLFVIALAVRWFISAVV